MEPLQRLLAQPDRVRRHFDEFVILDEFQRLLQREFHRRRQRQRVVLARSTEVRELLRTQGVDRQVIVLGVDADDLTFVDFL